MRKLIDLQTSNEAGITCDNNQCSFKIPASIIIDYDYSDPLKSMRPFINVSCPNCGENLLTKHDFDLAQRFYNIVTWMNKWFSWLTIFYSEKNKVYKKVSFHEEIKID